MRPRRRAARLEFAEFLDVLNFLNLLPRILIRFYKETLVLGGPRRS